MVSNMENQHKISKNFYLEEFLCRCGNCRYSELDIPVDQLLSDDFVKRLQLVRDEIGKPFKINSGARCYQHNALCGGAPESAHLVTGLIPCSAADISTRGWSGRLKYKLIQSALDNKIRGIGVAKHFIHLDMKFKRIALWGYGE